jgi:tetratricopeptide (TPR) repeat protein
VLASRIRVRLRIPTGLVVVAVLASAPARGQVAAPSMVDEDLPQEEAPPQARKDRPPVRAGEPVPEPPAPATPEPEQPRQQAAPAVPAPSQVPQGARAGPAAVPGVTIGAEDLARLQRPIEPVRASWGRLVESWRARHRALREHDLARAEEARKRTLADKRELAIENLLPFAGAEVLDTERSVAARSPDDALQDALFAVELAPDLAAAHLALARARFARDPTEPMPALRALAAGLAAAVRDPRTARALVGDLASALLGAILVASAATVVLLLARRLRLFLHDFGHLPLLRSGSRAQAALVALVLLGVPLAMRLGPFVAVFTLAAAAWLYLSWRERVVATVALLCVVALPWLAWRVAEQVAWSGTLAESVYELERGGDSGALAARLEARAADLPAPALLALGRHYKRRGDLERALRWYEAASAASHSAEAQVNLGNVLFLRGDLEGAKAAYLRAVDGPAAGDRVPSAATLAAAQYDLSKLYLRLAAVEQSIEARKKAQQQDAAYLARYGSDDDFSANLWLVDAVVPLDQVTALARTDPGPAAVGADVEARLAGAVPRRAWPWLPLGLTAALWVLALAGRWWHPAVPCAKCGRAACRRCDGVPGPLCGQCVNVYQRSGTVEAKDRTLKEAQVRRHARRSEIAVRALALVGGGAGHVFGGRPVRGFLILAGLAFLGMVAWLREGVLSPPQPSPYAAAGKLLVAVPAGLALWALAVRDAFRLRRGE